MENNVYFDEPSSAQSMQGLFFPAVFGFWKAVTLSSYTHSRDILYTFENKWKSIEILW